MEELLITPAVIIAMENMDLIIRSGAYEAPPAHSIIKVEKQKLQQLKLSQLVSIEVQHQQNTKMTLIMTKNVIKNIIKADK